MAHKLFIDNVELSEGSVLTIGDLDQQSSGLSDIMKTYSFFFQINFNSKNEEIESLLFELAQSSGLDIDRLRHFCITCEIHPETVNRFYKTVLRLPSIPEMEVIKTLDRNQFDAYVQILKAKG